MNTVTVDFLVENFKKYNNIIFNNELPIIPIKLGKSLKAVGYYKYKINRFTRDIINSEIVISIAFNKTYKDIIDVLVHEMLHYYIAYKKIEDTGSHGIVWTRLANEISEKYGLNIQQYSYNNEINKNVVKKVRMVEFMYNGKLKLMKVSKNFNVSTLKPLYGVDFVREYMSNDKKHILMRTSVKTLHFINA